MEAAVFIGLLIGSLTSSYIFTATSTSFIFGLASLVILIALIYIKYAVVESVDVVSEDSVFVSSQLIGRTFRFDFSYSFLILSSIFYSLQTKFKALFDGRHVYDIMHVCFKKRENLDRAIIWLTIMSLGSQIFVMGRE